MTTMDSAAIGELLEAMRPSLESMAADILKTTLAQTPLPQLIPASVISNGSSGEVTVLPDGPAGGASIVVQTLIGYPPIGERVMLLFQPPAGSFIIGYIGEDPAPQGALGMVQRTTDAGPFTALVAIGGVTRTVTVKANRLTVATFSLRDGYSSIAGDVFEVFLRRDGTVIESQILDTRVANQGSDGMTISAPEINVPAGSHTYDIAAGRLVGTGNCFMQATATQPMTLLIEDRGSSLKLP